MSTRRARVQLSTRFLRVHDSTGSVLNPSRMVCMRSRQRDGRRASDPTIASRYLWSFACSEQEIDRRELIKEELNARIRTSRNHYCDCATCLDRPQGVNDYGLRCFQALGSPNNQHMTGAPIVLQRFLWSVPAAKRILVPRAAGRDALLDGDRHRSV